MDVNNQKEYNKELLSTAKAIDEFIKKSSQLTEESRSLTEELKDQLGIRSRNSEGEKSLLSLSRQITRSSQANKVELREQGDISKQIIKETEQLNSAKREQLIISRTIGNQVDKNGKSAIENADKIASINEARNFAQQNIEKTLEKISTASGEELDELIEKNKTQQSYLEGLDKGLRKILLSSSAETQRLALSNGLVNAAEENVKQSKKQQEKQDKINESMGVAGGLVAGLNAVAGKFAGAFGLKKVEDEMRKVAAATVDAEGKVNRLKVLGAGLKQAFKNLGKTLTDPTVIFGALMKGFTAVEKEQQNFRRLTGQNADAFRGINNSLTTTSEYLAGMVTLTKELGVNANVAFSPETVTTVAELTANMGMAGKEAANLAAISKISGTNLQDNLKSTEGQFKNFVKTNKVALNFGPVLSGIANSSDSVKLSLGNSQEAIGEAVMEAQKLGLTLDQVDNIAGKLLDFESSITAEMEAELLTGQQINLEKARELALNNDLAGLAKEIGNNQAVIQAFSTGNRIAQDATAKAMGMSREEMSKMIAQQKIQEGLTTEQVAAAADISLEEAQRLTTQQQITKSIEKMSQALAPIIGFFASLLSNSAVLYTTIAALATVYATKMVIAISNTLVVLGLQTKAQEADNASKVKGILITVRDTVVKYASIAAKSAWNAITFIGTTIQNSSIFATIRKGVVLAATTAYKYASIAAQVTWNAITLVGNAIQNLSILATIRKGVVLAATTTYTLASTTATAAWNAITLVGNALMNTQLVKYIALGAAKLIDTIRTWAGVGATLAQAGANATLSTSQTILGTTGAAAGGGMAAAGAGLGAFGAAAAPAIPIILAIGAALLMASPAIWAFSKVIEALAPIITGIATVIGDVLIKAIDKLPEIITAVADGFVTMMGAVTPEAILGLYILGPALLSASVGLGAFALALAAAAVGSLFGGGILSQMTSLVAIGPQLAIAGDALGSVAGNISIISESLQGFGGLVSPLYALADGLMSISDGLLAMSIAGLIALPVIGALTALSTVSEGLNSVFGDDSETKSAGEDKGSMKAIETKLDKLIAVISAGGDVYIDGAKVGKTVALATSKMG